MKLKPVVASLVVLGLMTPAFAKSSIITRQAVIDQNAVLSPICSEGWFNRITVGGIGSVVGIYGNHDLPGSFTKLGSSSDLYVNNANLLVNAKLSNWSKATLNLAYIGEPMQWGMVNDIHNQGFSFRGVNGHVVADEAYVTISDLAKYPFYMQVGDKYVPFGDYSDPYVPWQIESPAQMLAQINATTAIVGVTSDFGFYANMFAFRGDSRPLSSDTGNIRNWGAKIGYYDNLSDFNVPNAHVNFSLSYIRNLWDNQNFNGNVLGQFISQDLTRADQVSGLSVHGDLSYKALDIYADWVGALHNMFDETHVHPGPHHHDNTKFWGADVNATYAFKTMDHDSHLGAGIQWTGNGQWLLGEKAGTPYVRSDLSLVVPEWRLVGDYKVNLFKNTDLDLVVAHGKSYDFQVKPSSSDKDSRTSTVGLARLMVQF